MAPISMQHKADVLIVTVTDVETRAVLAAFKRATRKAATNIPLRDRIYRDLGEVNGARVFLALSEMGTSGLGASLQTVQRGIEALRPDAVVMVGIAYGINEQKQAIGDILVSLQLMLYELQRVGATSILPRGDRPRASARLISHMRSANLDWRGAQVRMGLLLTGEKLIDNIDYRTQLLQFESEAIGGEMEGGGLYAACQEAHVDWILIKAICDWADGNKSQDKAARQKLAAKNAAQFLVHVLKHVPWRSSTVSLAASIESAASVLERHGTVPQSPKATCPSLHVTDGTNPSQSLRLDTLHLSGNNNTVRIQQFTSPGDASKSVVTDRSQRPLEEAGAREEDRIRTLADELSLSTADVLDWPSTLPSGKNILRSEAEAIERTLADPDIKLICLVGEAGSGKSALLATVGAAQKAAGRQIVGMRLDRLPKEATETEHLRQYLGLSEPLVDAVAALAETTPVLVLIDQLDALCDLMTERAGRLSLILHTVERLTKIDRVQVVLAIRPFEYQRDVRLRRVRAEVVSLALPSWDDIAPHVLAADVDPTGLSEELREELRRPQALRTFLELIATGWDWRQLRTYHEMRERLWESHVESVPDRTRRRSLLFDLARWMGQQEQLTRPLAQLDEWRAEVGSLESAGWLRRTRDAAATGVSFRHQSLFDFVYARAMVAEELSLVEQVLQHQGLFIRRRVWSVLSYLREQSREQYLRELSCLWHAPKLRQHLKRLMLDFIGQVIGPSPEEVGMMRQSLRNSTWQVPALVAAARGRGWFPLLRDRELPDAMVNPRVASICVDILVDASGEDTDAVLGLMERFWLADVDGAHRVALVLSRRTVWNEHALHIAQRAVVMLPLTLNHLFEDLVLAAMTLSPSGAVSLVKAAVSAELIRRVDAINLVPVPSAPAKDAVEQYVTWSWDQHNRKAPIRDLFEGQVNLARLTAVVDEAPAEFVKQLWPVLEQALEFLASDAPKLYVLRSELHWPREFSSEPSSVMDHLCDAVISMARSAPHQFCVFLDQVENSDLASVHILLLKGLLCLAGSNPNAVVSYFRKDPRRMRVDVAGARKSATLQFLLSASASLPAIAQQQLAALFLYTPILGLNTDGLDARSRWRQQKFVRKYRLLLLLCLDRDKLTESQRASIEQEQRAQPDVQKPSMQDFQEHRAVYIQSPMSAAQMQKASDDEILKFFSDLPDDTDWHHPKDRMKGGSIEASRELAQLTSDEPERGLRLARQLAAKTHLRPVGMVIEAAAKAGADFTTLIQDIEQYYRLDPDNVDYQVHAADALSSIAQRDGQPGLPDAVCSLLRSWLRQTTEKGHDADYEPGKALPLRSILDGHGGLCSLPSGNYRILRALSLGLLQRQPPDVQSWISIVAEHAERQEVPRVWQALASHELKYMVSVSPSRGSEILSKLFPRCPELLDVRQGLILLLDCQRRLAPELTRSWLAMLRQRGNGWHAQAYGELLVLRVYHQVDTEWTRSEIQRFLANDYAAEPHPDAVRHGIAFMAAWAIAEEKAPELTFDWLLHLGKTEHPAVRAALLSVFRYQQIPPYNHRTKELLSLFIAQPYHLQSPELGGLLSALGEYVSFAPELVIALAHALLDVPAAAGEHMQPAARHVSELIDLALTLQNMPGQLEAGLDLFERLQSLNQYECELVLKEGDAFYLHPAVRRGVRPRRRRRIGAPMN